MSRGSGTAVFFRGLSRMRAGLLLLRGLDLLAQGSELGCLECPRPHKTLAFLKGRLSLSVFRVSG